MPELRGLFMEKKNMLAGKSFLPAKTSSGSVSQHTTPANSTGRRYQPPAPAAPPNTIPTQQLMSKLLPHYKATLRLGIPIAIGQIGVIIMGFADTMMVGRYATEALASASFVNSVFNLISFLIMGYSYGLTPLVSAHCGRGEKHEAGGLLKQALMANGLFTLVLLTIMTVLYFYVDRMGQPPQLLPHIRPYYIVIGISMIFVALFNAVRQFTDGTSDTATGMWILLTGNALNIVGNVLLIYGVGPFPELGLLGAGLSTLFSRIYMALAIVAVVAFRKRYAAYRTGFNATPLSWHATRFVNTKSLPIGLQMGMESGAFTFSCIMAGWIDAPSLAAFQVMLTIGTLGFLFYYSFGSGMSIRVATFVGLNDWHQVRLATRAGQHILCAMATLSSLTFLILGPTFIHFFTHDPTVVGIAVSLIVPLIIYQFGDAMQICYANALRGTSQVMSMMWIAFVSYIVVNIPAGYFLGFPCHLKTTGIFLAISLGLFTAAPLFYWQFQKVLKKHPAE